MKLAFDSKLHLLISFLLTWCIRGCVIKSWLAIVPLLLVYVGKEIYDCYKPNATGFSWKDLGFDLIGTACGWIICLLLC